MKLMTAIKKAANKAEQRHGETKFCVRRKSGLEKRINDIYYDIGTYGTDDIRINIDCSFEDLLANDWLVNGCVIRSVK